MRWMLPLGLLGFVVWAALPAEAGDRDKERIAQLEAENTALRTAFENLNKSTDRSIQALAKLGKDFAAMRADYERLQDEAAALRRASARMRVEHEKTILKLQEALAREQRAHADDQHKGRGESSATERAHQLAINYTNALNTLHQMRIALADTVAEAALEIRLAEERAEYADEQRDAMEKTMETEIKTAKRMAAFEAERRTEERENRNAYYGSLFRHVGPIAAKPLANLLLDSPAWHAPRIAPLLARMGSDAEEALPALETIASDEAHQRRGVARYAEEAIDSIRAALRARDRVKDK